MKLTVRRDTILEAIVMQIRWVGAVLCCGVVWCDVMWCGVVQCGMRCVVWCGVVWCGVR